MVVVVVTSPLLCPIVIAFVTMRGCGAATHPPLFAGLETERGGYIPGQLRVWQDHRHGLRGLRAQWERGSVMVGVQAEFGQVTSHLKTERRVLG